MGAEIARKRILVTGGAGFVGSNVCREKLHQGHYVDCVDSLITGRISAVDSLRDNDRFRLFVVDITDPQFFSLLGQTSYDEIYHLACPTGVPNIKTLGEQMLETCSTGTENVLKLANIHGSKLVYTSSAEVYGDPEVFPQHEEYTGNVDPVGPRSAYEEGKRFSEALVRLYATKYSVNARIVRLFNIFGPGMSPEDQRVIPQFIKKIREGKRLVVFGDGSQTRTMLYVDDLISALQRVMDDGEQGGVYNIGGTHQMSIGALADIFHEMVDADVSVEYVEHFITDHGGRLPDTQRVRSLGWEPTVEIREGLAKMLPQYGLALKAGQYSSRHYHSDSNQRRRRKSA